jgi:hypothetical protein
METFQKLISIFAALLAVGLPPDIAEEAAFRNWCGELSKALELLAGMTGAPQDDPAVRLFKAVVANDECWAAFYALVAGSEGLQPMSTPAASTALGAATAIDPATILAIIEMVMQLIQMWRNRKA